MRQVVSSSNIAAVEYNDSDNSLIVEFKGSGAMYKYMGIPKDVFTALTSAESIGRYFNANIKNAYKFERVS